MATINAMMATPSTNVAVNVVRNVGNIVDVRMVDDVSHDVTRMKRQRWARSRSNRGFHLQFRAISLK